METWMLSQPPYKTMFSLCKTQVISLFQAKSPNVNQTSLDTICHLLTSAVYKNQTSAGVMDFQNLAPVDLAWWIDGFMSTIITLITILLNTISIVIFTSSSLRSPTNTILAMISALDVLTCVLRAPLLTYVYLYQGYKILPSMTWCNEYNYLHNFVPSALHSTAFLLNMGLSVQRSVGVRDIRILRPICSYKGTIAITIVSFFVSAFIHSLYPITYQVTPVVALGKQMLESGKLQEVQTCKVSERYKDRFEDLSTSYAWARISALQLLPGIVMCVCNISLIAISYKTYNYRKQLIGAIGTIMNVNRGFEGDDAARNTTSNNNNNKSNNTESHESSSPHAQNNNVSNKLSTTKNHQDISALLSTTISPESKGLDNDISLSVIERENSMTKRGDGTKKSDCEFEFDFELSSTADKISEHGGVGGDTLLLVVNSSDLEEKLPIAWEDSGSGSVVANCTSQSETCLHCVVRNDDDVEEGGDEVFYSDETIVNADESFDLPGNMRYEERRVTQELDRIIHDSEREDDYNTVQHDGSGCVKRVDTETIKEEDEEGESKTPGNISDTADLSHVQFHDTENNINDMREKKISHPIPDVLCSDTDSKLNSMIFRNAIYENALEKDGQLSENIPDLKKEIQHTVMLNGTEHFVSTSNDCDHPHCEKDLRDVRSLDRNSNKSLTRHSPARGQESSQPQNDEDAESQSQKEEQNIFLLSNPIDNQHTNYENGRQSFTISESNNVHNGESSISSTASSHQAQNNNVFNTTFSSKDYLDTSLLSTASPERKGSDISSVVSSTLVEDTIISETMTENYTCTTTTRIPRDKKKKPKRSPKRRRGEEGSVAELRPTIMLVLVTSCTLLAELMVTVAIFINFMNQVVYREFVDEASLVTFILVSNLITMISFPINFVFFCGLSRPFRNTLIAYAHFVGMKISRICHK